jgi:putative ABC transport system permease protein
MKDIIKLAFRNFFRNTRRSIISSISIAIAITVIIFAQSYIKGMGANIIDNTIRLIIGHVRITTHEYERRERTLPLSEALEMNPEFIESLNIKGVSAVTSRIKFGVMLGEAESAIPALGYAVEPEKEKTILGFDKRITAGSYLDDSDRAVILGKELAKRLNLTVGDTLTVITRTAYDSPTGLNLLVKGIYATGLGGIDRMIFYIPLQAAQEMLDMENRVTEVIIIMADRSKAPLVAAELRLSNPELAVMPYQANPMVQQMTTAESIYGVLYFIILLVACSTIANTMLMVVFERQREIGMLKALGMGSGSIITMLLVESVLIGAVGSFVGTGIGTAFSYWLKYKGIDLSAFTTTASTDMPFGPVIYLSPTPIMVLAAFLLGLLASAIIAYLPVRRVTKLDPAHALRTI